MVEFGEVVRRRRMVRAFEDRPVPSALVDRILAEALRAPSAGFTQGVHFVVLEGRSQTELFWRHTSDASWRREPNWPALPAAPVVILPLAHRQAYLDRYAEPDKRPGPGRATVEAAWPVPYWLVDAAFATMLMLLSATDAGLGALFFRIRHGEAVLLDALRVPGGYQPIGAVALGWPAPDRPSPSLARGRRPADEVIHRGGW
jgi:nitroreductase